MTEPRTFFRDVRTPQSKSGEPPRPRRIPAPGEEVTIPPQLDPRAAARDLPPERGGPAGPEPTRFGDWENKGRCSDF